MSRLVIVRHGNTFAATDPPRRIGAATDLPLVPSGVAQAQALGDLFHRRGMVFDRAFAGPLSRTRQTASLILAAMVGAPAMVVADWLTEIDHGPDEGQLEAAVIRRIGAEALRRWEQASVPPAGWRVDRESRVRAWRTLAADPAPGDTLAVTSNGAARFALLALVDEASRPPSLKLATGAYGVLVGPDVPSAKGFGWSVAGWNLSPTR